MKLEDIGITKEDILQKVSEMLVEELNASARKRIAEFVNDEVKSQVRAQVSAIITDTARKTFDGTFQPVNHFGEKAGEPTTIRDLFVSQAKEWWTLKVDCNGKPTTDSWGNKLTMAQYHAKEAISEIVKGVMVNEFTPLITDAKTQLATAFTKSIQELVVQKLGK